LITREEISKMPHREKLAVMENLWEELSRDDSEVDMPLWHKDELDRREVLIESGEARFIDWDEAKRQIDAVCR